MSATPGARDEYSTGGKASRGTLEGDRAPAWRATRRSSGGAQRGVAGVIFAIAIGAALLLVAAEFTTLYQAHIATRAAPTQSVTAGSHNSYSMLPIAALAAAFGFGVWRTGARVMLLAIGVLGLIGLLIALLHDLPNAHAVGLANNNSVSATTTPNVGLYLETLGAILLIVTGGLGLMLIEVPGRRRARSGPRHAE